MNTLTVLGAAAAQVETLSYPSTWLFSNLHSCIDFPSSNGALCADGFRSEGRGCSVVANDLVCRPNVKHRGEMGVSGTPFPLLGGFAPARLAQRHQTRRLPAPAQVPWREKPTCILRRPAELSWPLGSFLSAEALCSSFSGKTTSFPVYCFSLSCWARLCIICCHLKKKLPDIQLFALGFYNTADYYYNCANA